MPIQFFNDSHRSRLDSFPAEIPYNDWVTFFTLSETDLAQIPIYSASYNRLGFALQMSALRFMGFVPNDLSTTPQVVISYLARQLEVDPEMIGSYGSRAQTKSDHLLKVMDYLGFRQATEDDLLVLEQWLIQRALEHDKPSVLYQLMCDRFYSQRIVRPGVTRLERIIATARQGAQTQTIEVLSHIITPQCQAALDELLIASESTRPTELSSLRRRAITNSPKSILSNLEKIVFLKEQGVLKWNLPQILNPNRIKQLATIARKSTALALRRMTDDRKYPILVAFVHQSLIDITDEAIDMFDRCLADTDGRAKRDLDSWRKNMASSTNEKVQLFLQMGSLVVDEQIPDAELRSAIFRHIPFETLKCAVVESRRIARPLDDNHFDFLEKRYNYLRQFTPTMLSQFEFQSNLDNDPLLEGIKIIVNLNNSGQRRIPDEAPIALVPDKWRNSVIDSDGKIDRHYYELCVLYQLRNALRSGDIWLKTSRQYANPETYLIPKDRWLKIKPEVCRMIGVPSQANVRLDEHKRELEEMLVKVDTMLAKDGDVRLENGELIISPLEAEERPESAVALEQQIDAMLPLVELTNLLIEVDRWTQFSKHFVHPTGSEPRKPEFLRYLYASLLAQACNLSFTEMAQAAGLSYDRLIWYNSWYIRDETLSPANSELVNFHYHQRLTQHWGGGTLSSSDGQRFPVSGKIRTADALPRYFGYGKGVEFYTWTSDQYSQYGTKVIGATTRDATYVLDEILDNETELPIIEHTTDTAGYTEIVFALFDLLGMQFSPRIRDLSDQHLYRIDPTKKYPNLESQLKGKINESLIERHWDDFLRIAGSLKMGWVTASLFISKLRSYPRKNVLTRALQEHGRLVKTNFILRYLYSEPFRRRINRQLNKGEALHSLRRFLFFAHEGKIRRKQQEEMSDQAGCLNLITNAIIVWNTVYIDCAIEQLKAHRCLATEQDVKYLSPARHGHLNPYGRILFDIDKEFARKELRPLRQLSSGLGGDL